MQSPLIKFFVVILASGAGNTAIASVDGYLSKLGPTSLRYQLPPDPNAPEIRLPPLAYLAKADTNNQTLQLTNLVAEVAATNLPAISSGQAFVGQLSTNQIVQTMPAATNANLAVAPSASVNLTPQMLVPLFIQQTGNLGGPSTVVLPAGFAPATPPVPAAQSSSATYTTSPHTGIP